MSAQSKLVLAVPSKGRLMDQAIERFAAAGLTLNRTGANRGYRGVIEELGSTEIAFLSASEIAGQIKSGSVHLGITGEDLLREAIADLAGRAEIVLGLGFGRADVVVAAPDAWLDVRAMADLDDVAARFHQVHGRRLKVATKYLNLARRFFNDKGVTGYRLVESLGATEAAPAAGTAEVIVDITSTGATLKANHLRILDDGLILKSQAVLVKSLKARWDGRLAQLAEDLAGKLR
jgi:ATP phosphoribosyltransferase